MCEKLNLCDRIKLFGRICLSKKSTSIYKKLNYKALRKLVGVKPVCFLKAVLKEDLELKPTS